MWCLAEFEEMFLADRDAIIFPGKFHESQDCDSTDKEPNSGAP